MSHVKAVVNGYDETSGDMKNIFYFNQNANENDIAQAIINYVYTVLAGHLHGNFHIENVTFHTWEGDASGEWYETAPDGKKVAKKLPPWGVGRVVTLAAEFVGEAPAGEKLPPQVAPYLYFNTAKPHAIAKKYFGDITATDLSGGNYSLALGAHLETVATNIKNGIGGQGCESWGPIYGFQNFTGGAVGRYVGTQRRRKTGRGS